MAKIQPPPKLVKNKYGFILTPEQLARRELVFAIYVGMGETRSINRLVTVLKNEHPDLATSRPSLERWSKQHQWDRRAKKFDADEEAEAKAQTDAVKTAHLAISARRARKAPDSKVPEGFDPVEALLLASNKALLSAMNATPTLTKPSDVKAMVDAAANALKLVETLQAKQAGAHIQTEIADEMARVLDLVEEARKRDIDLIVDTVIKAAVASCPGADATALRYAVMCAIGPQPRAGAPDGAMVEIEPDEIVDAKVVDIEVVGAEPAERTGAFAATLPKFH